MTADTAELAEVRKELRRVAKRADQMTTLFALICDELGYPVDEILGLPPKPKPQPLQRRGLHLVKGGAS
jgi:hypothetical protein